MINNKLTNVILLPNSMHEFSKLIKLINGALVASINDHGPITINNYSSTSKRILGQLQGYKRCLSRNDRDTIRRRNAFLKFE